jgi:hypothetical protein
MSAYDESPRLGVHFVIKDFERCVKELVAGRVVGGARRLRDGRERSVLYTAQGVTARNELRRRLALFV